MTLVNAGTPLVFRVTATDGFGTTADSTITVAPAVLDFTAVPKSLADIVAVPAGYTVSVLCRLGDPIATATPACADDGTDSGLSARAGDHHDGMSCFGLLSGANTPHASNSSSSLLVMNHEGCRPSGPVVGRRPAFYMGDDAQNEYPYKFVSDTAWTAADAAPADRLATGDKYPDRGTLCVARFDATGQGIWLPLNAGNDLSSPDGL